MTESDNLYEVRQFVFNEVSGTDERLCVTSIDSGMMPHSHDHSTSFTKLPLLTFFYANKSEKIPTAGYYVKITTREGQLLRGDDTSKGETDRFAFPPEYRIYPCTASITLEPTKRIPRPLYNHD